MMLALGEMGHLATTQYYIHHGDYLTGQLAQDAINRLGLQATTGVSQTKGMNVGVYVAEDLSGRLKSTVGLKDTLVVGTSKRFTLEEITGQTPLTELETTELVHS